MRQTLMFPLLWLTSLFAVLSCLPKREAAPPAPPVTEDRAVEKTATPRTAVEIPIDPQVTIGKLANGMSYYIRKNVKPENRMELRLAINAGSLQEDEDQRGLAHFVEHMAFNGSKNFDKQELVDYIQSIGMRFGADLNAYTGFDETVYMLQVPTDDREIMERAFLILEDWAHNITFETEEIEKERGVVVEEWRGGRGAQARLMDKQFPVLFKDSRYAERLPIGKKEIIETAPRDAFLRFYKEWYRPDLMAVVAVGDFEPASIESLIKKHFEGISPPSNPRERKDAPVPDHEKTLFSIESDPELSQSIVRINYKHPASHVRSREDYRKTILQNLNEGILNQRIRERTREENPPYVAGFTAMSSLVRGKDVFVQGALVKENQFAEGLTALLSEALRAKRFGFTQTELERQKKGILRGLERAYNEREKSNSSRYASMYANHFLEGSIIPGIEYSLKIHQELLPGITLEEVNRAADHWITPANRVITITAPEKEGLELPSADEVLAVMERVEQLDLKPYQDNASNEPLLAAKPKPGRVVDEKYREDLKLWEWRLDNGIRIILKPTDFKNDEIRFSATSPGGSSLVPDSQYVPAISAILLLEESGLGSFDSVQLEKMLTGKVVSVNPFIGELEEGFSGSASPADLETLFQLLYLYVTEPRIDQKAVASVKVRWKAFIENRDVSPERVFGDEITARLYQNHYRRQPINLETLEKFDKDSSLRIYRDRFADMSDFTFVFVGNFEPAAIKPLLETYLGGMPSLKREETWQNVGADYAEGRVNFVVRKGVEPKATVQMMFTGDADWSSENRYALRSLSEVLRIRLREVLREDMGGVYGVRVSGSIQKRPRERFRTLIRFVCDPEKVEELVDAIFMVTQSLSQNGVEASYLAKVRETQSRQYETNLKQNSFWLSNLDFCYDYGLDPANILLYPKRIEKLSSDTIREAARRYLNTENYLFGVLKPEVPATN